MEEKEDDVFQDIIFKKQRKDGNEEKPHAPEQYSQKWKKKMVTTCGIEKSDSSGYTKAGKIID